MVIQTAQTKRKTWQRIQDDWQLYLFVLPELIYVIVFQIFPLYGIQIAFRNYRIAFGIQGSPWVGLEHFKNFFRSYYCGRLIGNTFIQKWSVQGGKTLLPFLGNIILVF